MNPCITIDVSKESSHVQGFLDINVSVRKAKKIEHTLEGFAYIDLLFNQIKTKSNIEPLIIFEYTGVYHKSLQSYLEAKSYKFCPVPPLVAAKFRKSKLREKKTDAKDCLNLSFVYYENKMKIYYQPTNDEKKLKDLHKFYDQCLDHYQKITVNLMESLDSIYPFYKRIFSEFDSTNSLKFLQTFPHPGLILIHKPETIAKRFKELTSHSLEYSKKIVEKLLELISKTMPGCRVDSFEVEILRDLATQALFYKQRLDKIQNEMKSLAATSKTQLFNLIKSIPGVGDNLTSRFIAEVMNLDRFRSSKALIAYAGTDPHISQSGKISGEHLSITKYGNKKLRNIVFLMVRSMTKNKAESTSVKDYYYKKKTQPGFVPKVALVACINKLLTIIYLMNKNSQVFIY